MAIAPIPPHVPGTGIAATGGGLSAGGRPASGPGFGQMLSQVLNGLNQGQVAADHAAQSLASGGTAGITTAIIAAQKADLSLQLAIEVRNRAVSAYQQLMQMQV